MQLLTTRKETIYIYITAESPASQTVRPTNQYRKEHMAITMTMTMIYLLVR